MIDRPDKVSSFVPSALLKRLDAENEQGPVDALFSGAVLYADISQYTVLAERLCEQGAEGIEKLASLLDDGFSTYVGCVKATGGEVAEFAGDAFLAYWVDEQDSLHPALERAKECARLLHSAFAKGESDTALTVPLHIGVGTGNIWAARLGGIDHQWHLLFAGDAVREATQAALGADAGETLLSPAALSTGYDLSGSGSELRIAELSNDDSHEDEFDANIGGLVPRVVQEWVSEGLSGWLPQIRNVSALFVQIEGLDENAPDALQRFQSLVESLQTKLRPYTNSNGVLVVDDKGLIFKLCLGLPNDSHSDDMFRAVRAGFALESELSRLGLKCAAGVAAGKGICLPLGGPERQHYVAVGRFMHQAARLMQEAGHGLLSTDQVAERVRHEFGTTPTHPVELKGIKGSTRPFRIHQPQQAIQVEEKLFGREFETRQIDTCLDGLVEGQGRVLWVVGDAGLGKTALVNYLKRSACQRDISVLEGGSASIEVVTPYVAWRPVFEELLGSEPQARQQGFSLLPHPELAPLINTVLDGLMEETEAVRKLSDETRAKATNKLLSQVVSQFAREKFVLILEDCHWMDSASWRLLVRIVQDHPSALVFLTSRPAITVPELDKLRLVKTFSELALAPLRREAVRDCVENLVQEGAAGKQMIDEITDRALGNPLYAREYTLLLASNAGAGPYESGWAPLSQVREDSPSTLPETVQGLITSRLDALSADEAFVLKSASVLGDWFRLDLLRAMQQDASSRKLDNSLANLITNQMLVKTGTAGSTYEFRHALIREVTYDQLTSDQREFLHTSAARAIEQVHLDHLEPKFATLAYHWQCTGDAVATVKYADLAASQAYKSGAYPEAAKWLQTCLDLPARERTLNTVPKDRIRWSRKLADAHQGMGRPETRGSAAREALAISGRIRPHSSLGISVNIVMRSLKWYWLRLLPKTRKEEKIDVATDLAQAYRHSAEVCYFNNDMLGMIHDCLGAVRMAEQAPKSAVRGSAYTELGGIISIAGLRRLGEGIQQRGVRIAEEADEPAALAHVHMVLCLYFIGTGHWGDAEKSARKCQELCEPIDDSVTWTNAQAGLFWLNHYQNKSQAALEAAQLLQERAYETGNRQHQAWALRFLSLCDLRWKKPEMAVERLEAALELLGETAAVNERIPSFGLLALAKLRSGDVWGARATARDGIALLARVGRPIGHSTLEAYSALAEIVFDAWQQDPTAKEWRGEARDCLNMIRRYQHSFPVGQPRYWYRKGEYYECQRRYRQARRSYRRGEAVGRKLGMPLEQELCAAALSRLSD